MVPGLGAIARIMGTGGELPTRKVFDSREQTSGVYGQCLSPGPTSRVQEGSGLRRQELSCTVQDSCPVGAPVWVEPPRAKNFAIFQVVLTTGERLNTEYRTQEAKVRKVLNVDGFFQKRKSFDV